MSINSKKQIREEKVNRFENIKCFFYLERHINEIKKQAGKITVYERNK